MSIENIVRMDEREMKAVRAAIAERDAAEAASQQVRRAAIKAGLMGTHGTSVAMHKLEAFAAYLLDEENEACAKVADGWSKRDDDVGAFIGKAIRARRKA